MEGPNESKQAGDSFHALHTEQELQCTCQNLDPQELITAKGLLQWSRLVREGIFSNEQLRRGGVFKNGAVVLHLDINHPDILEFINTPRHECPGQTLWNVNQGLWDTSEEVQNQILLASAVVTF